MQILISHRLPKQRPAKKRERASNSKIPNARWRLKHQS